MTTPSARTPGMSDCSRTARTDDSDDDIVLPTFDDDHGAVAKHSIAKGSPPRARSQRDAPFAKNDRAAGTGTPDAAGRRVATGSLLATVQGVQDVAVKDLVPHPANTRIYPPDPDEDAALDRLIEDHGGQRHVIYATQRRDPKTAKHMILGGNREFRILVNRGASSVKVKFEEPENEVLAIIRHNAYRTKTDAMKVEEGLALEAALQKLAKERQREGGRRGGKVAGRGREKVPADLREPKSKAARREGEVSAQVAREIGMPQRTYQAGRSVLQASDDLPDVKEIKERFRANTVKVTRAATDIRKIESGQQRIAQRAARKLPPDKFAPRVIHGDAIVELEKIEDGTVQLLLVDPPYGASSPGKVTPQGLGFVPALFGKWDLITEAEYVGLMKKFFAQAKRVLTKDGSLYLFCDRLRIGDVWHLAEAAKLVPRAPMVWHKYNVRPAPRRSAWTTAHESFLFATREKGLEYVWNAGTAEEMQDVLKFPICTSPTERTSHPTQKPLKLLEHLIAVSSEPGALVVDCFAGSGSTGEAAYKLRRKSLLIEKDEGYVRIIKRRIELLERDDEEGGEE